MLKRLCECGSCPSGLASNVMAYLAKANLALSVTLTAVSTLLAPLLTPLLMRVFARQFIPIDFWGMMVSITRIVILPTPLLVNHLPLTSFCNTICVFINYTQP